MRDPHEMGAQTPLFRNDVEALMRWDRNRARQRSGTSDMSRNYARLAAQTILKMEKK